MEYTLKVQFLKIIMRRKLFFVFLICVILVFLFDYLDIDLSYGKSKIQLFSDETHDYLLSVDSYKKGVDKTALTCSIISIDDITGYKGKILLNVYDENFDCHNILFSKIEYKGVLNIANTNRNPHTFNYNKYLKGKGVFLTGSCSKVNIVGYENNRLKRVIVFLDNKKEDFSSSLDNETKGIVLGVLFGDTSNMEEETYSEFRKNGTSHILAVSGLHISIIYKMLEKLLKNTRKNRVFIYLTLFCYGYLCMWSISVTRAILMIYIKNIARAFDLRYDTLTSLSIVGLLLLIINPYTVFLTSFQISFLAVISIAVISNYLFDKNKNGLSTSISVTLGTLGYQAYVFNYITPFSIVANVPIIFISTIFVPVSLISFFVYIFLSKVNFIFYFMKLIARVLIAINHITCFNGKLAFDVSSKFSVIFILISSIFFLKSSEYLVINRLRNNKKANRYCYLVVTIIYLIFSICLYNPITFDDVIFIDVGQGDAIHISKNSNDILIDGGGNISYNIGEKTLKSYFLKNRVGDVDVALATHLHTDHYKGIEELNESFKVKHIYNNLIKNDTIIVNENLSITTLWPRSTSESKDLNKYCSVFLVKYNGIKILITGDLDSEGELELISTYPKEYLKCDILKIGHHGSNTSTSSEFLDVVSPKYAVIQVGKNNYGHPSEETLYKLREKGVIILRNDINGAIGFKISKKGITYHTMF